MKLFAEFPAITTLSARKAFVLALARHGVSVPMSEIAAETIIQGNGGRMRHIRTLWQGQPLLSNAVGRFCPGEYGGGTIYLDFLQSAGETVKLPHCCCYTFSVTEDSCLQLTVSP